jgi:hypothetical protein
MPLGVKDLLSLCPQFQLIATSLCSVSLHRVICGIAHLMIDRHGYLMALSISD